MKLIELIRAKGLNLGDPSEKRYKYHLAQKTKRAPNLFHPLTQFYNGTFHEWQRLHTGKWFGCVYIISLIEMGGDEWLFAGVWKIIGKPKRISCADKQCIDLCPNQLSDTIRNCWKYDMEEISGLEELVGRVEIRYHNKLRAFCRFPKSKSENLEDNLVVDCILKERKTFDDPYRMDWHVKLSFDDLKLIMGKNFENWKSALSFSRGVYLITDVHTGKLYVGQADNSFWQRWGDYIKNGHGGDLMLIDLIKANGIDYARNFQFTILERVGDIGSITEREEFWKDALKTREHGNLNSKEGKKEGRK
jgi:hypothetical protein